jgi:hypothetical protein
MWVNGKLLNDFSCSTLGSDLLAAQQALWIGAVVSEVLSSVATAVYVDNVAAANGWIEH